MFEFEGNNYTANVSTQLEDYVSQLKRAKIVYMCSSIRKFALKKYVEAALAGTLIVGDIPAERQDEFREYVVEVDLEDDVNTVSDRINYWLTHSEERIKRARIGQEINLKYYTYDSFVENLYQHWMAYRNGVRGMILPHSFQLIKPWCFPDSKKFNDDCGFVGLDPNDIIASRKKQ